MLKGKKSRFFYNIFGFFASLHTFRGYDASNFNSFRGFVENLPCNLSIKDKVYYHFPLFYPKSIFFAEDSKTYSQNLSQVFQKIVEYIWFFERAIDCFHIFIFPTKKEHTEKVRQIHRNVLHDRKSKDLSSIIVQLKVLVNRKSSKPTWPEAE